MKYLYITIITACFGLGLLQIILTNSLATSGRQIKKLEKEIASLTITNQQIQQKIAQNSSLERIATGAAQLGLVPNNQTLAITHENPLAMRQ